MVHPLWQPPRKLNPLYRDRQGKELSGGDLTLLLHRLGLQLSGEDHEGRQVR